MFVLWRGGTDAAQSLTQSSSTHARLRARGLPTPASSNTASPSCRKRVYSLCCTADRPRMAQSLAFVPGKAKSAWGQAVWTACRHRGRLCVKVTAVGASGAGGAALAPASLRPGSSCALEDTPLSALSAAAACYRPAASGLRGEALSPVAMKIDIEHGRGTSQADSN